MHFKIHIKNDTNHILFVTNLASISYNKSQSKNPIKRFESLLTEAVGDKPARPIEFCPIVIDSLHNLNPSIVRFGFWQDGKFYTNLRAYLEAGGDLMEAEQLSVTNKYIVVEFYTPMFVWQQLYTHQLFTKQAVSQRYTVETPAYWLPDDFVEKFSSTFAPASAEQIIDLIHNSLSPQMAVDMAKELGYPAEIYQRFPQQIQYKRFYMGGWVNDPLAWKHLIDERTRPATQKETRELVLALASQLNELGYKFDN